MTEVKKVKLGGNEYTFYMLDLASDILHSRHIQGKVADMYIRFGLSREFLQNISGLLKKESRAAKDLDSLQDLCAKIAFNIEERLGLLAETKQYEELACIYTKVKINDELEPDEYIESWQQKKKDVWSSDKKLRDFFLSKVMKQSELLKDLSTSDIIHALKVAEARISQLPILANL